MGSGKRLLTLGLLCVLSRCFSACPQGQRKEKGICVDDDECEDTEDVCGKYAKCINTNGSYYCNCLEGYVNVKKLENFTQETGQCQDWNECYYHPNICGQGGSCLNLIGSYTCTCSAGYISKGKYCEDINECSRAETNHEEICGFGSCKNTNGSFWCRCNAGYTNYGSAGTPCSKLNCDAFSADSGESPPPGGLAGILNMMKDSCFALSTVKEEGQVDGETLLEKLFTATVDILSPGQLDGGEDVTELLNTVENSIRLIGPQLKGNRTKRDTTEIDADIAVQRGRTPPTGPIHLTNDNATLDTDWTTAAGTGSYPGFALAALLSYKNLGLPVNESFQELTEYTKDGVQPSFKVSSKVVSVVVSNPSTQNLSRPVNITLRHMQNTDKSVNASYICAFWTERGTWSTDGCSVQLSTETHTVCTCGHLSSFAVLMALYPIKPIFALVVATKVGLAISLLCLVLCILTFKFCRSIQGTRTTIHLHLCVCLFFADLIFLAGITQTKPEGACRFIAGMLHFFFLGVFAWMLLEGVQLYRMVVLVFNANIRPIYLFLTGYGTPLAIVIISAIIRPQGYGTDQHCWLSLEDGLIWSFYGPVCTIIIVNVFFFIITVWKLAQKFSSLNPDLTKLHKMKAFTVTAIAQMCILGLMWVFGAFLFQEGATVAAYIFTILNSLQGALVFIMHCLLSKQVRDEYANFLSCMLQKRKYSDFSSTNPSSSQSQGTRSGQHTGETSQT